MRRRSRFAVKPCTVIAASIALAFAEAPLLANPTGPQVVNGAVSFQQPGPGALNVTNSPGSIVNWQGFSIGSSEITRFIQQSASSAVLNRVVGSNVSQIYGQLLSNGRVFLINPGGIVVGPGAIVDTAGFVASTLNMLDADFLAGKLKFQGDANSGSIVNQGWIKTAQGGQVILVAPTIENSGLIHTPGGELILAAGQKLTISGLDLEGVQLEVQAPTDSVLNVGKLLAEGGAIGVFAGTLKHSGDIRATSLSMDATGQIVLKAQGNIELAAGSVTSASGPTGGSVTLKSGAGGILLSGALEANGATGQGGSVTMQAPWVALGGTVTADASANGGSIAVETGWLSLADRVSARGGSGAGGEIRFEVAGKTVQNLSSLVDASGASGGSIRHVAGQQITTSGTYLANGSSGLGGRIDLSAPATKLLSAKLHADGAAGGGQVRVGGEFQGGKNLAADELPNAELLAISSGSAITADATQSGAGGTVITWANIETVMYGDVSARPAENGVGGFIEISSGDKLTYGGTASAGVGGTVLFDPKNIVIAAAGGGGTSQYSIVLGYNYADVARLKGNDLDSGDGFGTSVSLSGTQLAVGATGDRGAGNSTTNAGAVYLFNNPFNSPALSGVIGKGYVGTGNVDLSVLEAGDAFGTGVALNATGNRLAVGAEGDQGAGNLSGASTGAVYLFTFTDSSFSGGVHVATIGKGYTGPSDVNVSSLQAGDEFGRAVALNGAGNRLAVGADLDDGATNGTNDAGAVRLFTFTDNSFSGGALVATIGQGYTGGNDINMSGLGATDRFGGSGVALNAAGDRLVVGARGDDGFGDAFTDGGAVYLFSFTDTSFSGGTLSGTMGKGYTGGNNVDVSTLVGEGFGGAVALNAAGDRLAVGAATDNGFGNSATDSGAVHLFTFTNTSFAGGTFVGTIGKGYTGGSNVDVASLEAGDLFGRSVALNATGDRLVIGAQSDDGVSNLASGSGAVRLFTFTNTSFAGGALVGIIGKGYASSGSFDVSALAANDFFGQSVSLSGTQLAVGAPGDDGANNTMSSTGAVYLINDPFTTPALSGILGKGYTGSGNLDVSTLQGTVGANFGWSVSLSGTQLAVGAPGHCDVSVTLCGVGAVFLINNPFSAAPTLAGTIGKGYTGAGNFDVTTLEDAPGFSDNFGTSVSLSGTQLAVGALGDDGPTNATTDAGAVYLINNPFSATPTLAGVIGKGYPGSFDVPALAAGDLFGSSVSLAGTQLAVGAPEDDGAANNVTNAGAVYLFNNPFTAPALAGIIGKDYAGGGNFNVSALAAIDLFGSSVSLSGTQLAVGAPGDDGLNDNVFGAGAVYLFNTPFTAPALAGIIGKGYTGAGNLDVSALEAFDQFGYSVSLSSTQLAVGAPNDDGAGNATPQAGAVYLFNNPFTAPALVGVIGRGYTTGFDVSALAADDNFGVSVSLSGTQLAVGAFADDGASNNVANAGAVYLFNAPFTAPALVGIIGKGYTGTGNFDVSALEASDFFGRSVSLSGTQLAVGAYGDAGAGNAFPQAGAVYLFNNPFTAPALAGVIGKGYTGTGNFDVSALEAGDLFGVAVSLAGTQLAVGAPLDDGATNGTANVGAVYLINNPFSTPALAGVIGKGYTGAGNFDVTALEAGDQFGVAVSLAGTQLAVGAPFDAGAGNATPNAGAVYLINNPFSTPALAGVIGKGYSGAGNFDVNALEASDLFGWSVSLSGTQLAVGAFADDGAGNNVANAGAVYLLNAPFTAPVLASIIGKGYSGSGNFDVAALAADDNFGISVSLAGTQLAVGAYADDGSSNSLSNSGAVYGFNLAGGGDTVASATFANNPSANSTITPAAITAITNTGSAVVLQANNDITVNEAVVTSAAGSGGAITMQAGRSVLINTNITTDDGNLSITANDPAAQAANRDAGAGGITMATGTTLNAGTGTVALTVGAGVPGATSGNLVVENITAANVSLQQNGRTSGSSILRASSSSLITATNLLMEVDFGGLASGGSIGTSAAPMRVQTSTLEAHTHEASPGIFIESPNAGNLQIGGVPFFVGSVKGVQNVTSGDISITVNGNLTTLAGTAGCGATGGTGGPICGDNLVVRHGTGGTVTIGADVNVGAGQIDATSQTVAFSGSPTLTSTNATSGFTAGTANVGAGTVTLDAKSAITALTVSGGTLDLNAAATANSLALSSGTLTGAGDLTVSGSFSQTGGSQTGTGTTILGPSVTATLGALTLDRKLTIQGTLDLSGTTLNGLVTNSGTLNVSGSSAASSGILHQAGTIAVATGQTLTVGGPGLDWQGGSLLGTSAASYSLSSLTFSGTGARVLDGPTFNLSNLTLPGGSMTLQSGALNLSGTTTILSGATLAAAGGALTAAGPVMVGGTLQASAAGPVNAAGQIITVPTAGVLDVNGGTVTASSVDVTGGLVKGTGTVAANLNNSAGTVAPGASPGILNVSGNYVQGPSGTFAAEIGGTTPGTQYDQLSVTGNVTLDGTLDVVLLGGFVPAASDTFTLIEAGGTLTGTFATTNIPVSAAGFTGSYPASGFDLISSPSSSSSGLGIELVLREALLQDLVTDLALAPPVEEPGPRRVPACQ